MLKKTSIILLVLFMLKTSIAFADIGQSDSSYVGYVGDQFIVKFKTPNKTLMKQGRINLVANDLQLDGLNNKYRVSKMEILFPESDSVKIGKDKLKGFTRISFDSNEDINIILEEYANLPTVESVEKIGIFKFNEVNNDPLYQWHLDNSQDHDIDATSAWNHVQSASSVKIAVLDSGIRMKHDDLGHPIEPGNGNFWINWSEKVGTPGIDDDNNGYVDDVYGWDFTEPIILCDESSCTTIPCWPGEDCDGADNDPSDHFGHGTHVAGIIGAITNNSDDIAGIAGGWGENPVANGVRIINLKVGASIDLEYGFPLGIVRMDWAAQAIYYAVDAGAIAINCSWGNNNSGGMEAAADYAQNNDVLIVVAAGNGGVGGYTPSSYLCQRNETICVSATDSSDYYASFTKLGLQTDISAPGVNILSTFHDYNDSLVDKTAIMSGTSMATPMVVGAAALLKAYDNNLTGTQIRDLLIDNADDINAFNISKRDVSNEGRLNIFSSLNSLIGGTDITAPSPTFELNAYSSTPGEVTLKWTSPGDDKRRMNSTATTYEIRYQDYDDGPLDTEAEWSTATVAPAPIPSVAGTIEYATISGLQSFGHHYFQVRALDEVGNISSISNSALNMRKLSSFTPSSGQVHDIIRVNNYAYMVTGGRFLIADVTDPTNIFQVSELVMGINTIDFTVYGNIAYLAGKGVSNCYLYSIDISNPANPVKLDSIQEKSGGLEAYDSMNDVRIIGNYAFVADQHDGIEVYDISDPSNMSYSHNYPLYPYRANKLNIDNNILYVTASNYIMSFNVADPMNIILLDSLKIGGILTYIEHKDNYIYASNKNGLLSIIDITSPSQMVHVNNSINNYTSPYSNISIDDNFLVAGRYNENTYVLFDISTPTILNYIGQYSFEVGWGVVKGINLKDGIILAEANSIRVYNMPASGCCDLAGDCNNNGFIDISDLVILAGYLTGGPPGPCLDEMDVNGDGIVNSLDQDYLVAFMFLSGQSPVCP